MDVLFTRPGTMAEAITSTILQNVRVLAIGRSVQVNQAVDPKAPKKEPSGGGLNPARWAAAGYGETDPVAGNLAQQSDDDRKKNRRVELVVQPNVEEMLNLNTIR